MENLWILPIAIIVIFNFASIAVLYQNNILYSGSEVFLKTLLILFLPVIGGGVVLYQIGGFYKENKGSGDPVMWYAFWDNYSPDSNSNDSYSSYDSSSGDSGGGSGGE